MDIDSSAASASQSIGSGLQSEPLSLPESAMVERWGRDWSKAKRSKVRGLGFGPGCGRGGVYVGVRLARSDVTDVSRHV